MKDPLVITNHLSCAHIHKPTHSCKYTHPFIRKQSLGRSRAREEPHSRTAARTVKLKQLVCAAFVVSLAPEPVSTEGRRCNNELVVAFSRCLFLLNSFIAAGQMYYGMRYSVPLLLTEPVSPHVFRY